MMLIVYRQAFLPQLETSPDWQVYFPFQEQKGILCLDLKRICIDILHLLMHPFIQSLFKAYFFITHYITDIYRTLQVHQNLAYVLV